MEQQVAHAAEAHETGASAHVNRETAHTEAEGGISPQTLEASCLCDPAH